MAKRTTAATQTNGNGVSKNGNLAKPPQTSIAYESTRHGNGTAETTRAVISEVTKHIGSRTDMNPATQASLLLNSCGKQIALANTELRAGVYKARKPESRSSFFLS